MLLRYGELPSSANRDRSRARLGSDLHAMLLGIGLTPSPTR